VARTRIYLDEFTRRLRKSCPTVSFDCRVQRAAGGMVTPREWLTGDIEEDERLVLLESFLFGAQLKISVEMPGLRT